MTLNSPAAVASCGAAAEAGAAAVLMAAQACDGRRQKKVGRALHSSGREGGSRGVLRSSGSEDRRWRGFFILRSRRIEEPPLSSKSGRSRLEKLVLRQKSHAPAPRLPLAYPSDTKISHAIPFSPLASGSLTQVESTQPAV